MIFVIKNLSFLVTVSFFCCLRDFEYYLGYFWNNRVLWQHSITSFVIFVNGEFFLSCAIYNNSATTQCEQISLKSVRCTVPL
jgi:hypothetical protein